jgi:hypothetical protein
MDVKTRLGDSDESEDALRLRPDPARQSLGGGLRAVDATLESTLGGLHLSLGLAAVSFQLSNRLVALPPPGHVRTAARGGAASFGFAELRRRSALQGGDLAVDSALTPQGLDRLGDLLTCRSGGPNRCIGNPLRSPAQ